MGEYVIDINRNKIQKSLKKYSETFCLRKSRECRVWGNWKTTNKIWGNWKTTHEIF